MKKEKSLGRILSQYSYVFVFLLILVAYACTVYANGNTFKFSHVAAILASQNTVIIGTIALGMAFIIITGQIDLSASPLPLKSSSFKRPSDKYPLSELQI